jgi:hypothetical protein
MGNSSFAYQLASDLDRDGMALELIDARGNVVAEVFRFDAEHSVKLATFQEGLPSSAIQDLASTAIARLGPFEDGTPLDTAADYADLLALSRGRPNKSLDRTLDK